MKLIKKADIFLIAVILLAVLLMGLFTNTNEPCEAVIYLDGTEYMRLDLDMKEEKIINIGNVCIYAYNGKIQINHSDCPTGVCVNSGAVYKHGSVIACVPNKIVIEVRKNNNYVDGVTG